METDGGCKFLDRDPAVRRYGYRGLAGFVVFGLLGLIQVPLTGSYETAAIIGACGGAILGFVGFLCAYIAWILVPPIVMMENVGVIAALRRSGGW
jgi:hypothetical protein